MFGLARNGMKTVAVIDIQAAIGITHPMQETVGIKGTGIMIRTMATIGHAEAGKVEKERRNNLVANY